MKLQFLLICCVPALSFVRGQSKRLGRSRRLSDDGMGGPCSGFKFSGTCPSVPALNPDMSEKRGLSSFAHEWTEYTCCQIVSAPLREIVSAAWMWKQVCTTAMGMATDEFYSLDATWAPVNKNITLYEDAPLRRMQRYCPQEVKGGELTQYLVSTFFPVMEELNPNFKSFLDHAATCNAPANKQLPVADAGSVTVLLSRQAGSLFDHASMILHGGNNSLQLPPSLDTELFVDFLPVAGTMGSILTGTKAEHAGFGTDLADVTATITIHNANIAAMQRKWRQIKENDPMFNLLSWNCARTVMEILQAGFPDCIMPLHQLWTPERAFQFAKKMADTMNDDSEPQLPLEEVHARQIHEENAAPGVPVATVVASVLGSVLGTVTLAIVLATAVMCRMKATAYEKLESSLATLLIGAAAEAGSAGNTKTAENTVLTEEQSGSSSSRERSGPSIVVVVSHTDSDESSATDFEEFTRWAEQHGLEEGQAKRLWKDLDKNHDSVISKKEWSKFIQARPNLKWLVARLKSAVNHDK